MVDVWKLETAIVALLIKKTGQDALIFTDAEIEEISDDKYIECYRDYENKTYTLSIKRFSDDKG